MVIEVNDQKGFTLQAKTLKFTITKAYYGSCSVSTVFFFYKVYSAGKI